MAKRGYRNKTKLILNEIQVFCKKNQPVTVRQLYYRLVTLKLIKNSLNSYKAYDKKLTIFRENGDADYQWFADRTREPIKNNMWVNLVDYMDAVKRSYHRNSSLWQNAHVEVWLEKDALSGVLEEVTSMYDLTLVCCRGFDSATNMYEAAQRLKAIKRPIVILYFGDFDPSGEDMFRDIQERLANFGIKAQFQKVALTRNDLDAYSLPTDYAKKSDSRYAKFVAKYGDISTELDALPPDKLKEILEEAVLKHINKKVWQRERDIEEEEISKLEQAIRQIDVV